MDAAQSQQLFKQADALFKQGQYEQALQILEQLNRAFPNEKNILYPAALCCERLGRKQVALQLCQQLLEQFQDPRVHDVMARLNAPQAPTMVGGMPGMAGIDALGLDPLGPPTRPAAYAAPQSDGPNWKLILGVGGGILAVVLLLIVLPALGGGGSGGGSGSTVDPGAVGGELAVNAVGEGMGMFLSVFLMLLFLPLSALVLYFALRITGHSPNGTFVADYLDALVCSLVVGLLGIIPLVGWVLGLIFVAKRYELGCVELLILYMVQAAIGVGIFLVILGGLLLFLL